MITIAIFLAALLLRDFIQEVFGLYPVAPPMKLVALLLIVIVLILVVSGRVVM